MRINARVAIGVPAVLAALLLGAIAPALSGAAEFTAAEYPATATGSGRSEVFATEAGDVTCETVGYHGELAEASPTLSLAPSYADCEAFGFAIAEVDPEGCEYLLHLGEEEGEGQFAASADLVCPEGQSVKIDAFSCSLEVKSQSGLTTVLVANGEADLELTPEIEGIEYVVTNDGFLCPFSGTGTKEDAELSSEEPITVEAEVEVREYTQVGLDAG